MNAAITEIIEISDIWPDTEVTVRLFLARSMSNQPFIIWAETKSERLLLMSYKGFACETQARAAFNLLIQLLVEINDPIISLLKEIPTTDPQ